MEQAKTHTILLFFWFCPHGTCLVFLRPHRHHNSLYGALITPCLAISISLWASPPPPPLLLLRSCQYTPFTIFSSHKQTQTQSFSILLSAYVCVKIIFALQSQFYFQFSIFYFFLFDGVFAITLRGRG